ncbi:MULTISPECIES: hypothetical protein [unclassified Archaeoglobus]|jgi:DNA mismatch repair ATPase MutL|uniref:hypothetical protein n=1 Tax=unclassified Archaeoglobus TaxID=2643606 RepID=UPI0025BEF6D7|nr:MULTISPECIES: hypothetical protein [unclassified Archaeoglobus]
MPGEENGKTENDSGVFAICLKCGNRWKVRKLDAKKRKCPVCGSYRTALESDAYSGYSTVEEQENTKNSHRISEDEEAADSDTSIPAYSGYSTEENNGFSAEKQENSVEKEKKRIEKREEKKRKKQEKKPRRKTDDEIIELDDEAIDELISEDEDKKLKKKSKKEEKSRSWLLWIAAAIFIFGLLYWFLSSLGSKKCREASERQPEQEQEPDFGGAIPGLV